MMIQSMGTSIYAELTGQGSSRVVLLHGWGCETKLMKPVADELSRDMQVLNIDFPGHGKSGRPPEPWGVPEYAECLKELLEKQQFLPCSVVAHSFGGRVAIWLAAHYPEMFTRIVLTGAAGIRKPQTEEEKKKSDEYKKLRSMASGLRKISFLRSTADKMEASLRKKYGSADYNALDEEMRKTFVKVVNQDLSECLSAIQQPTLLLWGENDTSTPLWMGQKMEQEIPDAGLVVMKGGTHFAYLEQIAYFNRVVRYFLQSNHP